MIEDLEQFTQWQDRTEARLATLETVSDEHVEKINDQTGALVSMDRDITTIQAGFRKQEGLLQALHFTQNEHIAALRELRAGQKELQLELRRGHAQVLAGMQEIVKLLNSAPGSQS
jgi:hypothetical protein